MKYRLLLLLFTLAVFNQSVFSAANNNNDVQPQVIIKGYKFIPQKITIKRGQKIRWQNQEKRQYHSVWFEASAEEEPEDYLFSGDSYQRQFNQTGSFSYRCGPHPEMTGIVYVLD